MSKLEELIQQYCPDGVEWKTIDSVTKSICSGLNPRKNFTLNSSGANCNYLTVKEMASGKIVFSDKTDKITKKAVCIIQNRSRLEVNDILLSGIGTIGRVAIVDIPVGDWNCSESVLLLKSNQSIIKPKYLKYILESTEVQGYFNTHATGSTLKGIRQKDLRYLEIPVPPLPVQEEIVRILDTFTELQAELQAELQKRKLQYNYYLDNLLNFNRGGYQEEVRWMKLKDVATQWYRGAGIKREEVSEDGMPCIRYGEIHTTYNIWFDDCISRTDESKQVSRKYAEKGDILFAITSEDIPFVGNSVAYLGNERILVGGDIVVMKHNQDPKYMTYALSTSDAIKQKGKGKVKSKVVHTNVPSLQEIVIPIPSMTEQKRIASILDRFDSLTNDLAAGLPAEIEKRRQQYEYYRDKLLSFKRKEA